MPPPEASAEEDRFPNNHRRHIATIVNDQEAKDLPNNVLYILGRTGEPHRRFLKEGKLYKPLKPMALRGTPPWRTGEVIRTSNGQPDGEDKGHGDDRDKGTPDIRIAPKAGRPMQLHHQEEGQPTNKRRRTDGGTPHLRNNTVGQK